MNLRHHRNIFTYWHQGVENAPLLVRSCLKTHSALNTGWSLHQLDERSIGEWLDPIPIPEEKWNRLQLAHRSDIIRTQLLVRFGGVWADPTIFFRKSLDDWLPGLMGAGVFMFHRPGRDRIISNWFIAAEPGNLLLQRQYDALCAYWRDNDFDNLNQPMNQGARWLARVINRNLEWPRLWLRKPIIKLFRAYPYMIYHYMIYDLLRSDAELNAIWDRMPKVSADAPHFPAHKGLFSPVDDETRKFIDGEMAPLFKLTWKLPTAQIPEDSVLDYILSSWVPDMDKRTVVKP